MPNFYGLLNDQCDALVEAMEAFVAYMEEGSQEKAKAVRAIEKRADALKMRNLEVLNRAFSTPMDREDIYRAVVALDMGINYAKTTTREMEVLNILPDHYMLEMAIEYKQSAEALRDGFRKLSTDPVSAEPDAQVARKAERRIEKIYRSAVANLFDADTIMQKVDADLEGTKHGAIMTVVDIFKRREVYRHLSNGGDQLAWAAERLRDIIVKIS
jgi:uncharacterized protein Yka (UPF0111/DUF47 family)